MPRGSFNPKIKPEKATKAGTSAPVHVPGVPSIAIKPTRTNTDRRVSILMPSFLSQSRSETKLTSPLPSQTSLVQNSIPQPIDTVDTLPTNLEFSVESTHVHTNMEYDNGLDTVSNGLSDNLESSKPATCDQSTLTQHIGEENTPEPALDTFEDLTIEETQSSGSSLYSRDSLSIYSNDSASIYSSASSIYSSGASIYSFDECGLKELDRHNRRASTSLVSKEGEGIPDLRVPCRLQYPRRASSVSVRRSEAQDAASRERSTLVRKAALFKNSRLPPNLPSFSTSLPTWSMICRAAQASLDCYDSESLTRRGTYTPANTSKDIKAMILDDQLIDHTRLVIVAVRGTEFQSLSDWAVNKAVNPVKPVGFLDNDENACHAGFLQVAKAMVAQIVTQLQQHPASSEKPSLLFTGHSAGGAVAAMLYSHMLSTSVQSDLTALASQFPSINCVTFGAPPLSLTPFPRRDHGNGIFLAFANEGDPVLRLSNTAYVKSLAKLMTASSPSSAVAVAQPVKVVRRSRGSAIIRQAPPVKVTPWEELPLWPTPPVPLANAGEVVLLRDKENGNASASQVEHEQLSEVIFGDLAQHGLDTYMRRVKEVALAAMMGWSVN